jgi:hypothetical protein
VSALVVCRQPLLTYDRAETEGEEEEEEEREERGLFNDGVE